MGSGGAVVRVGATVRRPWRLETACRPRLPRPPRGRRVRRVPPATSAPTTRAAPCCTYVEGDVAIPPFPAWAASGALLGVGRRDLQRRLHEAARSFEPPPSAAWDRANLPPAGPGAIVCHNDLCVENVVVRDGVAVAFIDFDFAAPERPAHRHRHRGTALGAVPRPGRPVRHLGRRRPGRPVPGLLRCPRPRCRGPRPGGRSGKDFLDRALVSVRTQGRERPAALRRRLGGRLRRTRTGARAPGSTPSTGRRSSADRQLALDPVGQHRARSRSW